MVNNQIMQGLMERRGKWGRGERLSWGGVDVDICSYYRSKAQVTNTKLNNLIGAWTGGGEVVLGGKGVGRL